MLSQHAAMATVAVKDMASGQRFYQDVLGLRLVHSQEGAAHTYESGGTRILVYQSDFAGTNRATAVTWEVGTEMGVIVAELASKGVTFEHYDDMPMKLEGDVYVADGFKIAWFKDPDGNIHALTGS